MGFCMDVNFQFIWANIKVQIAGLCDECIEFCSCLAVLKSGCTILHFHQQWVKVPAAPRSYHHLELPVFWILAILIGVSQYLIILLICISRWNPVWNIFFRCLFAFVYLLCWGVCLCPTVCDPMDCHPPRSSVHGILQARILEWVAIPFSRGIFLTQRSNPGFLHCRQILYHWPSSLFGYFAYF